MAILCENGPYLYDLNFPFFIDILSIYSIVFIHSFNKEPPLKQADSNVSVWISLFKHYHLQTENMPPNSRGARGVAGLALDHPDIGLATPGDTPKFHSLSLAIGC